jgi:CheY-like chemotaxis protein
MATILVVDDSTANVELMDTIFTKEGHEVLKAHNGQAGLEIIKARKGQIDILITDTNMPVLGGVDLIKKVKREFPHIKTILTSLSFEVAALAQEAGADRYLIRNGNIPDILTLVGELLAEISKSENEGG